MSKEKKDYIYSWLKCGKKIYQNFKHYFHIKI